MGTLGVCEGESRLLGGPCHSQVKGEEALAACPEGRHIEESQWGEKTDKQARHFLRAP